MHFFCTCWDHNLNWYWSKWKAHFIFMLQDIEKNWINLKFVHCLEVLEFFSYLDFREIENLKGVSFSWNVPMIKFINFNLWISNENLMTENYLHFYTVFTIHMIYFSLEDYLTAVIPLKRIPEQRRITNFICKSVEWCRKIRTFAKDRRCNLPEIVLERMLMRWIYYFYYFICLPLILKDPTI